MNQLPTNSTIGIMVKVRFYNCRWSHYIDTVLQGDLGRWKEPHSSAGAFSLATKHWFFSILRWSPLVCFWVLVNVFPHSGQEACVSDWSQRSSWTQGSRSRFLSEGKRVARHGTELSRDVSSPALRDLWSNLAFNRLYYWAKWWIPKSSSWGAAGELAPLQFENKRMELRFCSV